MTILLDTNVLVWILTAPEKLPEHVERTLADTRNKVLFSTINIWEIAIKFALNRADFRLPPLEALQAARDSGFTELPFDSVVAASVADLPPHHHGDPFDRLLLAQALSIPAHLYTTDRTLAAYSELVTLVR